MGDVADAAARRPAGRRARRGRPLRRRVAQRQLARRPVARSCRPTWSARSRCSRRCARHGVRLHHVSTDEVYGDLELDDPKRFTEDTPYHPSSPYSASKAGSDHLVRAWVRSFGVRGDDLQLLQQLRPVAARREVHPAPDHQRARRRPARSSTAPAPTCATGSTSTTTAPRCWTILERGRIGETYLIGADGERSNLEVVRLILRLMGRAGGRLRPRHRPGRPRPALRHRGGQASPELGWRPTYERLRGRAWRAPSTGTASTRPGGARTRPPPSRGTPRRASESRPSALVQTLAAPGGRRRGRRTSRS